MAALKFANLEHQRNCTQLETTYKEKLDQLRSSSEARISVLEEGLHVAESRLRAVAESRDAAQRSLKDAEASGRIELTILREKHEDALSKVMEEKGTLLVQRDDSSRLIADLTRKVNELESSNLLIASKLNEGEMSAVVLERDALLRIVEQQNRDHDSIQRMSQTSLKMVQQRQTRLGDRGAEDEDFQEGALLLQESLQSILAREGSLLRSEILDAKYEIFKTSP